MRLNNVSASISDSVMETTVQALEETIDSIDQSEIIIQIQNLIPILIEAIEEFESNYSLTKKFQTQTPALIEQSLDFKIKRIYDNFFKLQNLILAYMGQKVLITYVHVGQDGKREIRIVDNDISHLAIQTGSWRGREFHKIGYDLTNNYQILKNSLPDTTNKTLQETAQLAEQRYNDFKKIVWWKIRGQKWAGYQLYTKGPLNEAFVNFYLNTRANANPLRYGREKNLAVFMTHPKLGAIQADYLNGFLLGDVSRNNLQFAVKGDFGSPQGFKQVAKELKKLSSDFSEQNLKEFIKQFTTIPEDKASQIRQLTEKEINWVRKRVKDTIVKQKKS